MAALGIAPAFAFAPLVAGHASKQAALALDQARLEAAPEAVTSGPERALVPFDSEQLAPNHVEWPGQVPATAATDCEEVVPTEGTGWAKVLLVEVTEPAGFAYVVLTERTDKAQVPGLALLDPSQHIG